MKDYPIQIVTFFAEWCPNCQYEVKFIKSLFLKYYNKGLGMTLIMDYAPKEASDQFIINNRIDIPVQYGELNEKDETARNETLFYKFRKSLNDSRSWGLPFHLILKKKTDTIGIAMGEFIEVEIRSFLKSNMQIK